MSVERKRTISKRASAPLVGALAARRQSLVRESTRLPQLGRAIALRPYNILKRREVFPSGVTGEASRQLNVAAGFLALAVLADSAIEHYRGSFHNKAMYTPLVVSSLALLMSAHGVGDRREQRHTLRHLTYVAAAATGFLGTAFHLYNVAKQPGGFNWLNLFYNAPLGAPAAITLSGLLGAMAEGVRNAKRGQTPRVLGIPAGKGLAAITSAGLMGTVGEVGLLHFRGAYQNPLMFLPVTVPVVAAGLLSGSALGLRGLWRRAARVCLQLTSVLGFAGVGLHAYGVHRGMGGWRNWQQNILNGPPLPAPPSFTGLALAGLAALALFEAASDA
jgi:hypothetical protein